VIRIFGVQLRKELRESWRTRKVIIVLAVLILFGLASPILAKITPDLIKSMGENQMQGITITIPVPTEKDAIIQFVKNTTQFGLLLAVLMTFGAVVGEKEHGQAALMFPHPLPREVFVLAKFAAQAILFALAVLLSGLGAYLYTVLLFKAPDVGRFAALLALIYLWLLCLVALSLLASTLGQSITSAGGLAFVFVIAILLAGTFTNLAPGKLLNWGQDLATSAASPGRWGALAVTLVISALAIGASCVALRRQEIG
jgi:ABC-2 type transport system permease protein